MQLLFAIVILTIVCLIGSRITFHEHRLPLGVINFLLTGTEYLFLGILFGVSGLQIIDQGTLSDIKPALFFLLNWIGLLYGSQFDLKTVKKFPLIFLTFTLVQSTSTFLLSTVSLFLLLSVVLKFSFLKAIYYSLLLGAVSVCTAQTPSSLTLRSLVLQGEGRKRAELLQYVTSVDSFFALILFGLVEFISLVLSSNTLLMSEIGYWILGELLAIAIPVAVFVLLSRTKIDQQEFTLLIIGLTMLSSGIAVTVHHIPLLTGFWCGLILANISPFRVRILELLVHSEKSAYIALLLLTGASWRMQLNVSFLLLVLIYFAVRAMAKLCGGVISIILLRPGSFIPLQFGLGLIPEGGLAVAMILGVSMIQPFPVSSDITGVLIITVFLTELLGPSMILSLFSDSPPRAVRNRDHTL